MPKLPKMVEEKILLYGVSQLLPDQGDIVVFHKIVKRYYF